MAARAITSKVYLKPRALLLSSNHVYVSPRRTITRPSSPAVTTTLTDLRGTKEWKIQKFDELAHAGIKLLQKFQKEGLELDEEEDMRDAGVMLITSLKNLWEETMLELKRRHLEAGWASLRDFLRSKGMENSHCRLLLSIKHLESRGQGEEDILEFATASPEKGLTCLRRSVVIPRPGPYELPRQTVRNVACITTKDAFLLYDPTTGDTTPWIETTTTSTLKGIARRQVESIALGFSWKSCTHKVVCISSYEKKRKRFVPEKEDDRKERLVVEVLSVWGNTWDTGEHEWRRLKVGESPSAYLLGHRIAFMDGPVYADGKIHWLIRFDRMDMYVLKFDVETEDFKYIQVPEFIIEEYMDSARRVRLMLMEVDDKVAILTSTSCQETSTLCICKPQFESQCDEYSWMEKEKVLVPYTYVHPAGHSVEALARTDLIFMQSDHRIEYYNRKTGEFTSFKIPTPLRDHHFGRGRMMQLQ